MDRFAKIVLMAINLLTIFVKHFILDAWQSYEYASVCCTFLLVSFFISWIQCRKNKSVNLRLGTLNKSPDIEINTNVVKNLWKEQKN